MRLLIAIVLSICFAFAAHAQQANLSGPYAIEGQNPDGAGRYQGRVTVQRKGDTYQIVWQIGQTRATGTGIFRDGKLAVVFQPQTGAAGVAFFELNSSGSLSGTWTSLGGGVLGTEQWTPQNRS
ncbi:hypothetical protein GJW-30_1_00079 [Variibacter gotjawalensis]|uniref:Uncharacterized protein n=1 Tax=Variibacter gotjawalensis TaxID=1333996 RepID=A0A0S3PNQ4_9BRAD|nr:hypothetical protein [Variibacter gotjawalensis]NIK47859.1 hypothetical protein [Variibacter gotjawalensis]RZS49745.1 hypothetical protein EV661_2185 [Variibacter gotjawalensis]BAT57573.1 hypothetical protein GJW-30_1_00079 [Variibacter gotjawalensis]